MDHTIQSFRLEIQAMFQKSFQSLNQKNQLNKNILSNLLQAATNQSQQISEIDNKLEYLNSNFKQYQQHQTKNLKNEVHRHEQMVHDKFTSMINRLQKIQQNINNSRKSIQSTIQQNKHGQQKIDKMVYQLEDIIKKQNVQEYKGDREQLFQEIEEFENLLKSKLQKEKANSQSLEFYQKTALEPLNTFETKMALHNKANEEILKDKLMNFTQKIKKLQKKIEETNWMMNSQISKSTQEQRKIVEEMNILQNQMSRLRVDLESTDEKRKQTMQSHAMSLDNLVEEMLLQAKKLETRVESLRKGYQNQNERLKNQINYHKMTL